jgi:hypothetical protein
MRQSSLTISEKELLKDDVSLERKIKRNKCEYEDASPSRRHSPREFVALVGSRMQKRVDGEDF